MNLINKNHALANFLEDVGQKALAQQIRRAAFLLSYEILKSGKRTEYRKDQVADTLFYLTELAECLDPVLDAKHPIET